jgi:hypothetical protein
MMERLRISFLTVVFLIAVSMLSWETCTAAAAKNDASQGEVIRELLVSNQTELVPEADPDEASGMFLGFGELLKKGESILLKAAFPRFFSPVSELIKVNIYISIQLPDGSIFFLKQDGKFSPGVGAWRKDVEHSFQEVIIPPFPLVNPITGENTMESGTYVFSTLVVPSQQVLEDLSNLDWTHDLFDLCFYTVEIHPY